MKKLILLLGLAGLIGCAQPYNQPDPEIIVLTSIEINDIDEDFTVGGQYQMSIKTEPETKVNPTWGSSNPSVAAISPSGSLKIISYGSTTITASVGSLSDEIDITIQDPYFNPVEGAWECVQQGNVQVIRYVDTYSIDFVLTSLTYLNGEFLGENTLQYTITETTIHAIRDFDGQEFNITYHIEGDKLYHDYGQGTVLEYQRINTIE